MNNGIIINEVFHEEFFFVPLHLVGLIVGKNGYNIKKIQQETYTNILSPKKGTLPFFKIKGEIKNVYKAIYKIITYTNKKTGNVYYLKKDLKID